MTEIPEHLLKRAQAARDKAAVEGGATGEAAPGAAAATGGDAPAADPRNIHSHKGFKTYQIQ